MFWIYFGFKLDLINKVKCYNLVLIIEHGSFSKGVVAQNFGKVKIQNFYLSPVARCRLVFVLRSPDCDPQLLLHESLLVIFHEIVFIYPRRQGICNSYHLLTFLNSLSILNSLLISPHRDTFPIACLTSC